MSPQLPRHETTSDAIAVCRLQASPLDAAELLNAVRSAQAGAAVLFVGSVRELTEVDGDDRTTVRLRYDAYPSMAEAEMRQLLTQAAERWDLVRVAAVHRTGELGLGELAVVVAVSSRHRAASFEAGQWLLDAIKTSVPIWKQEQWADGQTEWQHPEAALAGGVPS